MDGLVVVLEIYVTVVVTYSTCPSFPPRRGKEELQVKSVVGSRRSGRGSDIFYPIVNPLAPRVEPKQWNHARGGGKGLQRGREHCDVLEVDLLLMKVMRVVTHAPMMQSACSGDINAHTCKCKAIDVGASALSPCQSPQ